MPSDRAAPCRRIYWWYLNPEDADEPAGTPAAADPTSLLETSGATVIESCSNEFNS